MTWRNRLRPASFRGVPFHVLESEGSGGRNLQVDEYPFGTKHGVIDLGARATRRRVTAYFVGDDVDAQIARFEAALAAAGPGRLVDPWRGAVDVHVSDHTTVFRNDAGRYAQVIFQAVLARPSAAKGGPSIAADTARAVRAAADTLAGAADAAFTAAWVLTGWTDIVANAAAGTVGALGDRLARLIAVDPLADLGAGADFAEAIGAILGAGNALILNGTGLAATVARAFTAYRAVDPDPARRLDRLLGLPADALPAPDGGGPASARARANAGALDRLVDRLVLGEACRAAAAMVPDSRDAARAIATALTTRFDRAVDAAVAAAIQPYPAVPNSTRPPAGLTSAEEVASLALDRLAGAVQARLTATGASAAPLIAVRPATPALVLAHRLYGTIGTDGARADDVARRLGARHPMLLPAEGQVLRV